MCRLDEPVAQLVEQPTLNRLVEGSSPSGLALRVADSVTEVASPALGAVDSSNHNVPHQRHHVRQT